MLMHTHRQLFGIVLGREITGKMINHGYCTVNYENRVRLPRFDNDDCLVFIKAAAVRNGQTWFLQQ